jgi:hypothetical protein
MHSDCAIGDFQEMVDGQPPTGLRTDRSALRRRAQSPRPVAAAVALVEGIGRAPLTYGMASRVCGLRLGEGTFGSASRPQPSLADRTFDSKASAGCQLLVSTGRNTDPTCQTVVPSSRLL